MKKLIMLDYDSLVLLVVNVDFNHQEQFNEWAKRNKKEATKEAEPTKKPTQSWDAF